MTPTGERGARVGEVLLKATEYLKAKGRESPRLGAEVLLANALGCDRLGVYLRFEETLSEDQLNLYRDLVRRRGQGEPAAYLVGEKEFRSLRFRVAPGVMIPRPETETLVEVAVEEIRRRGMQRPRVLDLGIGSGNVLIAVAKEVGEGTYVGVDILPEALTVARQNVEALCPDLEVALLEGNWFEALGPAEDFDVILSNPPYIPTGELDTLPPEISRYEPRVALDGGKEGLNAYREIARQVESRLRDGGFIAVEVGQGQYEAVSSIFAGHGYQGESHRDLAGRNRVILLQKRG